MFNSLRTDQLIAGIGATARTAAGATGPPDDYARGQLLSAYSVSRLLAAEVSGEAALLAWLRGELLDALGPTTRRPRGEDRGAPTHDRRASRSAGSSASHLLAELRESGEGPELRTRIHAILREMAGRELAALAARPEGSSRR